MIEWFNCCAVHTVHCILLTALLDYWILLTAYWILQASIKCCKHCKLLEQQDFFLLLLLHLGSAVALGVLLVHSVSP